LTLADLRPPLSRRDFLGALGVAVAAALAEPRLNAQQAEQGSGTVDADTGAGGVRTTMSGPMSQSAYRPVRLPAKAGAVPSVSAAARDELEHHLHCQCGCPLDVYTCRTTDFTCPVSPRMHQDVVRLAADGYSRAEIMGAFRTVYGERVLMAPVREGFNWAAYIMPFLGIGGGAAVAAVLIHRWQRAALARPAPLSTVAPVDATPEELARLDAAIRDDED
jgi:cytochrome c-type biogenesis protein CcmH